MGIAKSRSQVALILYVHTYVYTFEILVTIRQMWGRVLKKYPSAKCSFILFIRILIRIRVVDVLINIRSRLCQLTEVHFGETLFRHLWANHGWWASHEMVVLLHGEVMKWWFPPHGWSWQLWFRRRTDHDIMVSPLMVIMDDGRVLVCLFRRRRGHWYDGFASWGVMTWWFRHMGVIQEVAVEQEGWREKERERERERADLVFENQRIRLFSSAVLRVYLCSRPWRSKKRGVEYHWEVVVCKKLEYPV